jgi:hypothetical protein
VIGVANAGDDTSNTLKQASEFGIAPALLPIGWRALPLTLPPAAATSSAALASRSLPKV